MAILTYPQIIAFTFDDLNVSIQVGDYACYTQQTALGGFNSNLSAGATVFGKVIEIDTTDPDNPIVKVLYDGAYDDTAQTGGWVAGDPPNTYLISLPASADFILFIKDNTVNTSSLVGYYAEAQFVNNDVGKAELFSVGSEVFESSK